MDLFVRESGPTDGPPIVFLHGGYASGWSWDHVVQRLQQRYRCLVPDLPQYGGNPEQRPFEMPQAAAAMARLIRSYTTTGRANVVGFSLGAQVALQTLATDPGLVDRAVLCGTPINTMPGIRYVQLLVGRLTRNRAVQWAIKSHWDTRHERLPLPKNEDYRNDARLMTAPQLASIFKASAGFGVPEGLCELDTPALFLTGAEELPLARGWAATLAKLMPNGVDGMAVGMRHDWPLRYPDLFACTVDGWLSEAALPSQIRLRDSNGR